MMDKYTSLKYIELNQSFGKHVIDELLSYQMGIDELYEFMINYKMLCECSYEMQCAVCDSDESQYDIHANAYFIKKTRDLRVDKDFQFLNFVSEV